MILLFLSATPLSCLLYGLVKSLLILESLHNYLNSYDVNSPPLYDLKGLDFLLRVVLDQGFEFLELTEYFIPAFQEVYLCLPRKIINERNIVYIPTQ